VIPCGSPSPDGASLSKAGIQIGRITTILYDTTGLAIRLTGSTGAKDSTAYNASGLPIHVAVAGTAATNMRYAAWALVDSIWGVGQPTVRNFISAGKVDSVRVGGITTTKYLYDSRGRVTRVTDRLGHLLTKRTYYTTGQQNRQWDSIPGGRLINVLTYDAYGRTRTKSYQPSTSRDSMIYDIVNRLRTSYNAQNQTTQYAYDSLYLRTVTDAKSQVYGLRTMRWGRSLCAPTLSATPIATCTTRTAICVGGGIGAATRRIMSTIELRGF
jgi:YD repeat-containing protein